MKRALIIFAKLPRPGEVKTRLGETIGMKRAADLYAAFAEHAFNMGGKMAAEGIKVSVFYAPGATREEVAGWVGRQFEYEVQSGGDLGTRMQGAFEQVFAGGGGHAVIIGTDVPELDEPILRQAFETLRTHDVVVGPSTDGGYYLLGMNSPTKQLFAGVDWSSPRVLEQTIERITVQRWSYAVLPQLSDIDSIADYEAYYARRVGPTSVNRPIAGAE